MSTYDIQKIELPNGDICNIKLTASDTGAVAKVGDTMNGSLTVFTSSAPLILKHSTVDSTDVVQENDKYSLITFKDKNNLMTGEIGIHYCLDGANELRWKIYNYSSDGNQIDINQPVLRAFLKKDNTVGWGIASPGAFRSAISTNYKTYTSVADLNLTVNSATILDAYNAMGTNSILICPIGDFASSEAPTIDGATVAQATVEIIRANANGRGYIHCYGKTPTAYDWRMFLLQNNSPTGTWVRTDDIALNLAADSGTNQLTLAANGKYKLTVGAKTFIFTAPSSVTQKHPNLVKGTNPSATQYYMGNFWTDSVGTATANRLGGIEGSINTTGDCRMGIRAYKYANGSSVYNAVEAGIKADGTNFYAITDKTAFRDAIETVYRTYKKPSELGLTDGLATILQAYNKLKTDGYGILICDAGLFATSEVPNIYGVVEIVVYGSGREYVNFYGRAGSNNDWRMFCGSTSYNGNDGNAPSGTWVCISDRRATYTTSVDLTNQTVGARAQADSFDLPSGVTASNVKAIYVSKNTDGSSANVSPGLGGTGKLFINVYAAKAAVKANIEVTVVY